MLYIKSLCRKDDRFHVGLNYNSFKGDRRISVITGADNLNDQGYSSNDKGGISNGVAGRNKNSQYGINYINKFGTKLLSGINHFIRIHRSYIANINYVKKIIRKEGEILLLENKSELPVAEDKMNRIIDLLQKL
ncbi:MAG: LytTR family DNA-binding domain-containing protein [Segetibacter sp.]